MLETLENNTEFFTAKPKHKVPVPKPLFRSEGRLLKNNTATSVPQLTSEKFSTSRLRLAYTGGSNNQSHSSYKKPTGSTSLSRVTEAVDIPSTFFALNVMAMKVTGQKLNSSYASSRLIEKNAERVERIRLKSHDFRVVGKINDTYFYVHIR